MHYGKVSMGGVTFRILNFASHFIRVQIFQIDFPLIISASKYFRQISLSFYICRGQLHQIVSFFEISIYLHPPFSFPHLLPQVLPHLLPHLLRVPNRGEDLSYLGEIGCVEKSPTC